MPQVQAIVEDLAYAESINVSAPVKCVEDPNLETRKLVVYSWLVSILDKATIDLTKSELTYI